MFNNKIFQQRQHDNSPDDGNENDDDPTIVSIAYINCNISFTFYKMKTMQLYLSYETRDPLPHLAYSENLLQKIQPKFIIVSTCTAKFLKELKRILEIPADQSLRDNYVRNNRRHNILFDKNLFIYNFNRKILHNNYERILELHLPGCDEFTEKSEKLQIFKSFIPMEQEIVIQSLGNLLNFLDAYWYQVIISPQQNENSEVININSNRNIIISDLKVFFLESFILIDKLTFKLLKIFPPRYDTVTYKRNYQNNNMLCRQSDISIYSMFNRHCCSSVGRQTLRIVLQQPLCDKKKLQFRYDSVKWFIDEQKYQSQHNNCIRILQTYLRDISDINSCYRQILSNPNNYKLWVKFKITLINASELLRYCFQLENSIKSHNNIMNELCDLKYEYKTLKNVYSLIDTILDLKQCKLNGYFIVNSGLDKQLDEKRAKMLEIFDNLHERLGTECKKVPTDLVKIEALEGRYVPEIGYLIRMKFDTHDPPLALLESDTMKFFVQDRNEYYFRTELCNELNQLYNVTYFNIRSHEQNICNNLLEYFNKSLPYLQKITQLCGILDVMISFAKLSIEKNFTKPLLAFNEDENNSNDNNINESKKLLLNIKNGRNIIIEYLHQKYVPITTEIYSGNTITILSAPNASGKSSYLRQIALNIYLAHIGSFVPAELCEVKMLINSFHTKFQQYESIYEATSAFSYELQQLNKVLQISYDGNSLILLDEFGIGTNIFDGQAILIASIEELSRRELQQNDSIEILKSPSIVIITTHYSDIFEHLKSLKNIQWKTIQNHWNPNRNILVSSYNLINGVNKIDKYATKLIEVQNFIRKLEYVKLDNPYLMNIKMLLALKVFRNYLDIYSDVS